MKIEDILASKGREKKSKKGYTLQKSAFNCEDKKPNSGKNSKHKDGDKPKLDVNDPHFWEKVGLPFKGYNAKQLLKKYRNKKNDACDTKEH